MTREEARKRTVRLSRERYYELSEEGAPQEHWLRENAGHPNIVDRSNNLLTWSIDTDNRGFYYYITDVNKALLFKLTWG